MPFYQFNHFTGRLKNSTNLQPLYPISPNPLQSEPPKMIWDSIKTQVVKVDVPARGAASTPGGAPPPPGGAPRKGTVPPRLIAKMKKFQQPGWRTTPVYLMGGTPDKIMFGATVALLVYGLYGVAEFVAEHINDK
ncbi:uncharacterized protein LOC107035822 [Diachasma alloeum]|uniref:uncharacterized protein LOC107035822 n=1 Tax=Diachasma alloeum TaxID=454923 RepID=UPI0007381EB6|nr:uncharacterized protein LOC107035822 [Diachasma alloeum]